MGLSQSIHHILFRAAGGTAVANEARNMERSLRGVDEASRRLRGGLLGMTTTLAGSASTFTLIGLAVRRGIQAYSQFEAANARLRVVLLSGGAQLRTTHQLTGQLANAVARDLGYSLNEGTDAMRTMMETGLGTHRSMRVFRNAMELARVGELRSSDAIEFLTDTMNMFQGEMARTGEEIGPFSRRMSAQLVAAANLASTSVDDLRQAFRYAGTELSTLGYGSRDIMATLAGLSQLGLRGSMGGVRLRAAMGALINPSARTLALFEEYGIHEEEVRGITYDNAGQQRNLLEVMLQLHGLMARIPDRQRRAQLEMQMFGTRSLAAGISMAEFNAAAQRARDIFREMQGDVTQVFNRQVEERMRGFDIQMTQLKESANDLAIVFGGMLVGAFEENGQTFGTYMRQVSEGVMLLGDLGGATSENRRRWNALSPQVRENARAMRDFMQTTAQAIKTVGEWIIAIARFGAEHQTLVTALIGMKVVMGTWSSLMVLGVAGPARTIGFLATSIGSTIIKLRGFSVALRYLGYQGAGGIGGIVRALAVTFPLAAVAATAYITGWLGTGIQLLGVRLTDTQQEFDELQRTSLGRFSTWIKNNIPVLGRYISLFIDLANAISRLMDITGESDRRQQQYRERVVGAHAADLVAQRGRTVQGGTWGERRQRAINLERSESTQRAALLLARFEEGRNESQMRRYLTRDMGITGGTVDEVMRQVTQIRSARAGSAEREAAMADAMRIAGSEDNARQVTFSALQQLREFQDLRVQTPSGIVREGGQFSGSARNGVVVARENIPSATRDFSPVNVQYAPPTVAPKVVTHNVTVHAPVQINGREVARAVAQVQIQNDERGGVRATPGNRRAMRETGSPRAVR